MDTPTFTLENLTALNNAIAQGAKRVKYADKEIEHHSLAEMLRLRELMKAELGAVTSAPRRHFGEFSKGL